MAAMSHPGNPAFDPQDFAGRWKVIEGAIPQAQKRVDHYVILETDDGQRFELSYERGGEPKPHQTLYYNAKTRTLDSRSGDGKAERCVSFWDCAERGGKCRIFAMRRLPVGIAEGRGPLPLLPWEDRDDNGTWGAEEG